MKRMILLICSVFAVAACTHDDVAAPAPHAPAQEPLQIAVTRGNLTGVRTYRVTLFNPTTGAWVADGTYYFDFGTGTETETGNKTETLIPCTLTTDADGKISVDENGNISVTKDPLGGLYAPANANGGSTEYKMVISSPAVAIEKFTVNNVEKGGFSYKRILQQNQQQTGSRATTDPSDTYPLYVSDAFSVTVSGRSMKLTGKDYRDVLDVSDYPLQERRALIAFNFTTNESGSIPIGYEAQTTHSIALENVIKEARWDPINSQFLKIDASSSWITSAKLLGGTMNVDRSYKVLPAGGDPEFKIEETVMINGKEAKITGYLYLLAQDYKQMDNGETIFPLPTLRIEFTAGNTMRIPLAYDFRPHKKYVYTVTIKSKSVGLSLSTIDWEAGTTGDTGNGEIIATWPDFSIDFSGGGSGGGSGWETGGETGGNISGTIGEESSQQSATR